MFKRLFFTLIFLPIFVCAQIDLGLERELTIPQDSTQRAKPESVPDSLKIYIPKINDYKKWNKSTQKQVMDTTFSIENYFKKNVYQKDVFEYQIPSNWGKPLIALTPNISRKTRFAPMGKEDLFVTPEEIYFYDVKTPTTRFIFETGVQEGQSLSTLFTHSPNKQINYAIGYDALKSLGFFQKELSSSKNFNVSLNYHTPNNRYILESNFISQSNNSDENGGLNEFSLLAYTSRNPDFSDVARLTTNLSTTASEFESKSFYLNHHFGIFKIGNDSLQKYPFKLSHILKYSTGEYKYSEKTDEKYYPFEEFNVTSRISSKKYKEISNQVLLGFSLNDRLSLNGGILYRLEQPYLDKLKNIPLSFGDKITENRYGITANASFQWKKNILLIGDAEFTNGNNFGPQFKMKSKLKISLDKIAELETKVNLAREMPSYNFILNQSFYKPFNFNHSDFKNENIQEIEANLNLIPFHIKTFGGFSNVLNYTYLNENQLPIQTSSPLNYFKLGAEHHLKWNGFNNITKIQFQKVTSGENIFPIPSLIGRLTTYYQSPIFERKADIQTGINIKYHTNYNGRLFSPILNEFYLQEPSKEVAIGNYPQLDFFTNIKVRTMRIYLRAENLSSFLLPGQNLITPLQPFRNFKIQIGAYWTLFN